MQINPQIPSPLSSQTGALPQRPRVPIAARGTHPTIQSIEEDVARHGSWVAPLQQEVGRVVVGQRALIERLLVGLLSNGHLLLEGVPGLAKTLVLKTLAGAIQADFRRVQFTPDMLPADIVGTLIYNPRDGNFVTKKGPVFSNFVLADEINRAPAKVQSALLEAMQERQVTLGDQSYPLPVPFMVMATQNPVEQEGT
ncbi:MAG: AAA family ATPase, partial [Polyangiaceae bacterium]